MKSLLLYARQLGQRRTSAFHLLPRHEAPAAERGHHVFGNRVGMADRPRSLREMFSDTEYDNDDDAGRDDVA
jgi:hypothetical protein